MAAEDIGDGSPMAAALPTYPEMIVSAIEELNEKNGSSKTSIVRQIELAHGPLPPAHATLVTHHLAQMKQSGQLALVKNNFLLPDPTSPPKRGRGRPPKPKSATTPSVPTGSPRPRGRPPKADSGSSPSVVSPSRGRGRPPKKAKTASTGGDVAAVTGVKRGRGRPPKVKVAAVGV